MPKIATLTIFAYGYILSRVYSSTIELSIDCEIIKKEIGSNCYMDPDFGNFGSYIFYARLIL